MAMIEECMGRNLYDFDRDLLQRNLPELRVVGYEFTAQPTASPPWAATSRPTWL